MHLDLFPIVLHDRTSPAGHPGDPPPDAVQRLVVLALREMLRRGGEGGADQVDHRGDGPVVTLEHGAVRCEIAVPADPSPLPRRLSAREWEITGLVADGATNRAIGACLDISEWTVSTHIRRIFLKLNVNSRAEMVAQVFGAPTAHPVRVLSHGCATTNMPPLQKRLPAHRPSSCNGRDQAPGE
jgi:DNA-binding CsgD family transcriptional regulator